MYEVVIVGAGFAGTLTALELAKKYKVLLIEADSEVIPLTSSSYNECYKLHTGIHYIGDKKAITSEQCLINAVKFALKFPNHLAGGGDIFSPWRRGRHYIMANSTVSVEDAKKIALHLKELYIKLIEKNPENKIFGEPENFINFLEKEEYSHIAESIPYYDEKGEISHTSVVLGIETAESQIDIDSIKLHLQQEINSHSNITFKPLTTVTHIARCKDEFGYVVSTENSTGKKEKFVGTTFVNCAWQNIEKLDSTLGTPSIDKNRVNRIKASILVELPESLRNMNTCIFSSGPYCSITVLPNGCAILTSERITNVGFYNANEHFIPQDVQKKLSELHLDCEAGKQLANQILIDCASYLKEEFKQQLIMAKIKKIHVGFVKLMNLGEQYHQGSIYEKDSEIHIRQIDGVEHKGLGHVSNSGMKMTFAEGNAEKVSLLIDKDFALIQLFKKLVGTVKELILEEFKNQHSKALNLFLNTIYQKQINKIIFSNTFKMNNMGIFAEKIATKAARYIESNTKISQIIKKEFFAKPLEGDMLNEETLIDLSNP